MRVEYSEAVRELEGIAKNNWRIGEIAHAVGRVYGAETLRRLADDTGIPYATLKRCRDVHRAWPETAKRNANLPWSVHLIFAAQKDRFELIQSQDWTAAEGRAEFRKRNDPDRPDSTETEIEESEPEQDQQPSEVEESARASARHRRPSTREPDDDREPVIDTDKEIKEGAVIGEAALCGVEAMTPRQRREVYTSVSRTFGYWWDALELCEEAYEQPAGTAHAAR